MMSAAFSKRIASILGGFQSTSNYIYIHPIEHVLSGFCIERTSNSVYLSQVYLPICDQFDVFHLEFAHRIPHRVVNTVNNRQSAKQIADVLSVYIKSATSLSKLNQCMEYIDSKNNRYIHPRSLRTLGNAHLLLGNITIAKNIYGEVLLNAPMVPPNQIDSHFVKDTNLLESFLPQNSSDASNIVLKWEHETKETFGLS